MRDRGCAEADVGPRVAHAARTGSRTVDDLVRVRDEAGSQIALFQGTVYRKKQTLGEVMG
jgi:hypothetical protein